MIQRQLFQYSIEELEKAEEYQKQCVDRCREEIANIQYQILSHNSRINKIYIIREARHRKNQREFLRKQEELKKQQEEKKALEQKGE